MSGEFSTKNSYGFSTKYNDWDTESILYGFRSFHLADGRWLSRDPLGERGGLNQYAVTENKLINAVDPFGLQELPPPKPTGGTQQHEIQISGWGTITVTTDAGALDFVTERPIAPDGLSDDGIWLKFQCAEKIPCRDCKWLQLIKFKAWDKDGNPLRFAVPFGEGSIRGTDMLYVDVTAENPSGGWYGGVTSQIHGHSAIFDQPNLPAIPGVTKVEFLAFSILYCKSDGKFQPVSYVQWSLTQNVGKPGGTYNVAPPFDLANTEADDIPDGIQQILNLVSGPEIAISHPPGGGSKPNTVPNPVVK